MNRPKSAALLAWIGVGALVAATSSFPATGADAAPKAGPLRQLGFNSYVQDLCQSNATWASDASGQFAELKALGANSIALAFPFYMSSLSSNSVFVSRKCGTNFQTPSPARLAVAINEAHALHLRVFLRPLLNETVLVAEHGWRGVIRPKNVHAWFKSYLALMTPYLKLAQRDKVNWFAISTELDSMATKPEWTSVLASAKRYYKGPLIFADTWRPGVVTHNSTSPGLDAYQGAALPDTATPSELLAAWNYSLDVGDPLPFPLSAAVIDEVAILAQDGAYPTPWDWSLPSQTYPFNQDIQANWYSMVCTFFKTHEMQGLYFWGVWYADGANALPQTPSPGLAQEIQPASAAVIKACYTGK